MVPVVAVIIRVPVGIFWGFWVFCGVFLGGAWIVKQLIPRLEQKGETSWWMFVPLLAAIAATVITVLQFGYSY